MTYYASVGVLYFMLSVDSLIKAVDDIDDYNGFAYSSFNGPVSGDVKPIYFDNPYAPGETLVDYLARPDYKFAYGVSDPDTGNSQKHQESRDGDSVKGEYSLIEPDGYIRRVIYTADAAHGFQATVIYEPPSGVGALPLPSKNTYSSPVQNLPNPTEFPYEEIMRTIPDFRHIPIPHYDNGEPKQYDSNDIPYNAHEESKIFDSTQNFLEPKFYEDTTELQTIHPNQDDIKTYDNTNIPPTSDVYPILEEVPSNRVYESTEVTRINNMYDPHVETTSVEYEPLYE